jgi:hypothetical protein
LASRQHHALKLRKNHFSANTFWITSHTNQKRVLIMGETEPHIGRPGMLNTIKTMLTNHAPGE